MKWRRPPYILGHPGDYAGCGFHRVIRPLEILSRSGMCAGRVEANMLTDAALHALKPDIVLFQRQSEERQIEGIERYRRILPEAYFVYEIDDALSAVPDKSWHAPFMTPNIDSKLRKSVALCDVVIVTTSDLADHMRHICEPGTKVRVVPNMLGRDDFEIAEKIRKESPIKPGARLRIGWGGGIGHQGDIDILKEAFVELRDEVEWVFIGHDWDVPPGTVKVFGGATEPRRYLASLAAINVDLVVAPLEDHLFNRCKSNLRLIEAGACAYPVIASPVAPYNTDRPPVYDYPKTPSAWVRAIRQFISEKPEVRARSGNAMLDWAKSRYNLDDHAERRLLQMMPEGTRLFRPKINVHGSSLTVASEGGDSDIADIETNITKACVELSSDILYVRKGAHVTNDMVERMLRCDADVVVPLTNDGGPWGFPETTAFSRLSADTAATIDRLCSESKEVAATAAVSGPVVLMRRKALATIGCPDFETLSTEIAILEWSVNARLRGLKIGAFLGAYVNVDNSAPRRQGEPELAANRIALRWQHGQNDDLKLRTYKQNLELRFHRESYSILPPTQKPDYSQWASLCDEPGIETIQRAKAWHQNRPDAPMISSIDHSILASYTDDLDTPFGVDWLYITPDGTQLAPSTIEHLLAGIDANPHAKLIYTDHDFLRPDGVRVGPDLKPNFDLHLFFGRDYISQSFLISRELLPIWLRINKEFSTLPIECRIYAFVFAVIMDYGRDSIGHIHRVLAHLQPPSMESAVKASTCNVEIGNKAAAALGMRLTVRQHPQLPPYREVTYTLPSGDPPLVSIIIPCKNNLEMLAPCIATVLKMTDYPNYEILIVDNGSTRQEMLDYQASLTDPRIHRHVWDHPFNWSALNNWAVTQAKGDILCFLNDDTRVVSRRWLGEMVAAVLNPGVGSVGAKLVYPHGAIQHIGVVASAGMTGHMHKGLPVSSPGVNGIAALSHEATAATGACLVVRRKTFEALGGFEESLAHNFNDVAFGRTVMRNSMVNVIAIQAELQHLEGVTRSPVFDDDAVMKIRRDGTILLKLHPEPDPYWNSNFIFSAQHNGIAIDGMDLNSFIFPPPDPPWGKPPIKHALYIGPESAAIDEIRDNTALYRLAISGNQVSVSAPPMSNTGPWDLRDPIAAGKALEGLNPDFLLITILGDLPTQVLSFITRLGIPVIYRPINAEAVCPRGNMRQAENKSCEAGYKTHACQGCIDRFSSPQGHISIPAWRAIWLGFLLNQNVTVLLDNLDDESLEAFSHVFGAALQDAAA